MRTKALKRRNAPMICPSCQSVAIAGVDLDPKSKAKCAHPVPIRGAFRDRHGRRARDAMDAGGAKDESAGLRTVKSCGLYFGAR
jgi:hypothetical protein